MSVQITNLNEHFSDHSTPIASSPPKPSKYINWKKFSNMLFQFTDINPKTYNQSEIDIALSSFTFNIQSAIESSIYFSANRNFKISPRLNFKLNPHQNQNTKIMAEIQF